MTQRRNLRPVVLALAAAAVVGLIVSVTVAAFSSSTGNPPSSFTATSKFCTRTSAVWITGFEHGVVATAGGGLFNTQTGTPTADTGMPRNGAYSLRISDASAVAAVNAAKTFTATGVVVVRIAVRLSSLPAADVGLVSVDSGTDLVLGYDAPTQRFELTAGPSSTTSSGTVAAATWYVVDLRYDLSANPHRADWRVNEVDQTQVTRAAAATTATGVRLGSTTAAHTFTANYDDVYVANASAAYPQGNGRVVRLLPNGNGTHVGSGSFASPIDWQRVEDVPMSTATDQIAQLTNGSGNYAEVLWGNTGETCIRDLSAVAAYRLSAATSSANGKVSVFDGSTETAVFNGTISTGTTMQYASAIVAPAAAPWTQSAVDGLVARVGYSSDADPDVYFNALMLEQAVASTSSCFDTGTDTVTGSVDTWIEQGSSSSHEGASDLYLRTKSGQNGRVLVNFNLPAVPSGCSVTGATLTLQAKTSAAGRTLLARRVTQSWTGSAIWPGPTATTTNQGSAASIGAAGAQAWSVTGVVQDMYAGTNYGFLLLESQEDSGTEYIQTYAAIEDSSLADPQLTIPWG